MSYQVSGYCYATLHEAAAAACAFYQPVSSITQDGTFVTASCYGVLADPDNRLTIKFSRAQVSPPGGALQEAYGNISLQYQPCQLPDQVAAYEALLGPLLALFATAYGLWQVKRWVDRGARGESA